MTGISRTLENEARSGSRVSRGCADAPRPVQGGPGHVAAVVEEDPV